MSGGRGAGDKPVTYRGTYDPSTTYLPREVIVHNGLPYMATAKTVGDYPTSAAPDLPSPVATSVILTSPDGTEWRVTINNSGVLSTVVI